ncbi:MAG: hypothetical protein IJN17_04400, partial [Clostridia bacterium]|nr:hypothetical protein [Clostridia bacterium]
IPSPFLREGWIFAEQKDGMRDAYYRIAFLSLRLGSKDWCFFLVSALPSHLPRQVEVSLVLAYASDYHSFRVVKLRYPPEKAFGCALSPPSCYASRRIDRWL